MTPKNARSIGLTLIGAFGLSVALFATSGPANAGPKLPKNSPNMPTPKQPAPADKPEFEWFDGRISGIDTDAQGTILFIAVHEPSGAIHSKPGCGAKIADLPQIANGLGQRLKMRVVNNCIDRYTLMKY